MSAPSITYTFANSTTADATQVNQNFTDLINGASDGTKDYDINNFQTRGNTILGNGSGDDITLTGSLASDIGIKTQYTYSIGSTTKGLKFCWFGSNDAAAFGAKVVAPALGASIVVTLPGVTGTLATLAGTEALTNKTITSPSITTPTISGVTDSSNAAAGIVGELISGTTLRSTASGVAANTASDVTSISLTAGDWDVSAVVSWRTAANTNAFYVATNTSSATLPGGDSYGVSDGNGVFQIAIEGISNIASGNDYTVCMPQHRISINSTTTIYLVQKSSGASNKPCGQILARRVR